jgi:type IV pilus assembly protein PilQ
VNIAQSGETDRLVLILKQPGRLPRSDRRQGCSVVSLDNNRAGALARARVASPPVSPIVLNRAQLPLRDIDFRRGADGPAVWSSSCRTTRSRRHSPAGPDPHRRVPALEPSRRAAPAVDVTDFGTPVQSIVTTQAGDPRPHGSPATRQWEHSAYQSDNQFVLEVRAQKVDPNKLVQGAGYAGEKLSLNFQNIEVRALLQVIADFTNFNVVTSDTVTGNVTLRLKDVPWDQALDIILQAKNLGLRKSGNVILIAPKDELNAKEKIELEAKQQIAALEPLRTQSFQLNYAKAQDIANGLTGSNTAGGASGQASRILSPRGSVVFETRTNQLFVSDIPSKLEEIQSLIAKIDIAVRQVLIESRIIIADESFGRSLGVRLGFFDNRSPPGFGVAGDARVAVGGNLQAIGGQTGQGGAQTLDNSNFVSLPAIGQNGFSPASFALSLFGSSASRFLNLEISALEADGKGKVIASPRVITADQQKALIEQGEELPYQVATSSGATSLQFRKANLKLEVTPQITPEGKRDPRRRRHEGQRRPATAAGFAINTKHVKTQVLVENGGTVVIGGIFEQNDREDITKVPFLGDVPYLGNLFKTRTTSSTKTELLIFLTPKIVTDRTAAR